MTTLDAHTTATMTAVTEQQVIKELTALVGGALREIQSPTRRITVHVDRGELIELIGAKYAHIVARAVGFQLRDGVWIKAAPFPEAEEELDLDLLAGDFRAAFKALDPLGLLHPFIVGRMGSY